MMTLLARRSISYLVWALAPAIGSASLLLFGVFLFFGPLNFIHLGLPLGKAVIFDSFLCLVFFAQHSGMVRKSFQDRLSVIVSPRFSRAIYGIVSGMTLIVFVLFWQSTTPAICSVTGMLRPILRTMFAAAGVGFVWGVLALGSFDAFGTQPILADLKGKKSAPLFLSLAGPYRWVRHPLYSAAIAMLWSYPDLTADRLLLNVTWSLWIVLATFLEERDLVSAYGESYRQYQQKVPRLFPWRIP